MYILEDEGLNHLLDGEFYQVILAKQHDPNVSVRKLNNFQFDYKTYQGFRKFYRKYLEPIIDKIKIVEDDSLKAKVIRWLTDEKK